MIRNSESSPVLFGGSEILNPLLCCLEDQKFRLLYFFVSGIRNSESSPVFFGEPNKVEIKNRKLLGRILRFLANRETFPVSFNTRLRLRGNCKNPLWNSIAKMNFTSSQFYTHFQPNFKTFNVKKTVLRDRFLY